MVKIKITAETNGFVLLEHGEVFIKNNNDVSLKLIPNEQEVPLIINIKCANKGGRMASVERNIVNDKLVFTCNNFQSEPGNWGGIIEPMLIGETDEYNLYLSFLVWNIDTINYNRLLNYSFWLKEKKYEQTEI